MAGIFKAYDVRGVYPGEIDETKARAIGLAFQFVLDEEDRAKGSRVVVSRDMRSHSEGLARALVDGLTAAGLDVVDIGLATTPMNYFAVGHLRTAGGVQTTASHNPAQYNGFKFSKSDAKPVSGDHGIPRLTWWDHRGTREWVQFDFAQSKRVTGVKVYWFDDTGVGQCRVPKSWRVLYRTATEWKPVANPVGQGTAKDQWNEMTFQPVDAPALRMEVELQPGFSGGILEWRVE